MGQPGRQADRRDALRAGSGRERPRADAEVVELWDLSGPKPRRITRIGGDPTAVGVSSAGLIALGSRRGEVTVFDLAGHQVSTAQAGRGAVHALAFSGTGRVLASGGADGVLRLWDPRRGVELDELRGSRAAINAVALDEDGEHVASTGVGGAVRLWGCDVCGSLQSVLTLASNRVTRQLTPAEAADPAGG